MSNAAKEFFLQHWFQLGILAVGLFIAWIAYAALVIEPERQRAANELKPTVELAAKATDQTAKSVQTTSAVPANRPSESLASLQNQCADRAERFFESKNYIGSNYAKNPSYTNHYSVSMGECYIQISSTGPQYWALELYDATEGMQIAMLNYNYDPSTGEVGSLRQCFVGRLDNICSSFDEFTRLTKDYMTN